MTMNELDMQLWDEKFGKIQGNRYVSIADRNQMCFSIQN